MKVVFSFDDGRSDSFEAAQILYKYGLVGTFHIVTGFIDGKFSTDAFGKGRKSLSVEELLEMRQMGMEISSHGDKHIMDSKDFDISVKKMINWKLIFDSKVGFSIPNSNYTETQLIDFVANCGDSLLYVRAGRSPKCYSFISKVCYVLYKITKGQIFYNKFNKFNLNESLDTTPMFSAVVKNGIRPKSILKFIDKYSSLDKTLILMFHSIVDKPTDKWEYSKKNFDIICKGINSFSKDGRVKCGTIIDFLYGK